MGAAVFRESGLYSPVLAHQARGVGGGSDVPLRVVPVLRGLGMGVASGDGVNKPTLHSLYRGRGKNG